MTLKEYQKKKKCFWHWEPDQSVYNHKLAAFKRFEGSKDLILIHVECMRGTHEEAHARASELMRKLECQYVDFDIDGEIPEDKKQFFR